MTTRTPVLKIDPKYIVIFNSSHITIAKFALRDNIASGRIALSIKKGKKRKLVKGRINFIPHSTCDGLSWENELTLTPHSFNKLQELIK